MDLQTQWSIIYIMFLLFSINMTWILAKRHGISSTIDYLQKEGLLELDED